MWELRRAPRVLSGGYGWGRGVIWRTQVEPLCAWAPHSLETEAHLVSLTLGMQRGHVKGAESGNIGTRASRGGRKRYSEPRLWFI